MREIKFRAWSRLIDDMLDWEDIVHDPINLQSLFGDFLDPMQFTGLKDKNDKEIYEGDILRGYTYLDDEDPDSSCFEIHEVMWFGDDGYPGFDLSDNPTDGEYSGFQYYDLEGEGMEVIGNIYENPELLEGPK